MALNGPYCIESSLWASLCPSPDLGHPFLLIQGLCHGIPLYIHHPRCLYNHNPPTKPPNSSSDPPNSPLPPPTYPTPTPPGQIPLFIHTLPTKPPNSSPDPPNSPSHLPHPPPNWTGGPYVTSYLYKSHRLISKADNVVSPMAIVGWENL